MVGHLVLDEENRTLEYDALGRLIEVRGSSGGVQGSYDYDPLDAVTGVSGEQRFYQDGKLATQITDSDTSSFMHGANTVLAEQKAGADPKS